MANGGKDMLDELYKDAHMTGNQELPNCNITLGIRMPDMGKTESKSKPFFHFDDLCVV